ncbi:Chromodomain protein [Phytophthora cinnamomi]|uniref:Chromodomain protein n=1 Tax=Phytophthora cinnamomi TaxID=4785 RepID=UPI003559EF61|nr:Chromodomain protein [Phytophthora cinnamomi]
MERSSSSDKLMATGSDTPSLSSSSTASSSSGEGGAPVARAKAGLVASYLLRTAMDWRSGRVDTSEQKSARRSAEELTADNTEGGGDNNEGVGLEETEGKAGDPLEVEAEPDAASVDDQMPPLEETEQKGGTVHKEKKQFEVTYQCLPDVEEAAESEEDAVEGLARRPMQYLDVLLQTDERGVGLNVGLGRMEEDGGWVLVVQSFRRENAILS